MRGCVMCSCSHYNQLIVSVRASACVCVQDRGSSLWHTLEWSVWLIRPIFLPRLPFNPATSTRRHRGKRLRSSSKSLLISSSIYNTTATPTHLTAVPNPITAVRLHFLLLSILNELCRNSFLATLSQCYESTLWVIIEFLFGS